MSHNLAKHIGANGEWFKYDERANTIEIFVPFKISGKKYSTNMIYSGVLGWQKRATLKKELLRLTHFFTLIPKISRKVSVGINMTFINSSIRDLDNHSFLFKMLQDCLIHHGVIEDDSDKFISVISIRKEAGGVSAKSGARILLRVDI